MQVIGLAFQCLTVGENIGYVIPVSVFFWKLQSIEHMMVKHTPK